ncbi:MAG: BamA/TamA family outer membrane protein [Candidatus Thiodiazotropha sp. (ex Monitilora ramsayi)]|nr:BamA/TamA family outer membrane protein [Candidatus Thiodiazotropha sp. (ex Monitilora ramsayi)]
MATVFITDNDSWLIAGGLNNVRFDSLDRWFFDIYIQDSHYTDQRFYDSAHRSTTERAGFNDSSEDDYVFGISDDIHLELTARYPLPIGVAKNEPLTTYKTRDGLLVSEPQGGGEWNPLTSGKTTLRFRYFYRYRNLQQIEQENLLSSSTNGISVRLDYDNTDFLPNPSRGSRQKIIITRDFGWFNSSTSWTNIELDASKYIDLGTSDWFRHQVLAMNFWTSYTPSWDLDQDTGRINHRSPPGYGAFLGGFDRLRAFPTSRFQDKSAVYYGMELRLIPKINGLNTWPLLKHFEIDWWQFATFVEAGRVGPDYDADLFTKDLKWNLGLSFRIMAFQQPLRLDWAVSEEDYAIWAMYSQPFSR